MAQFRKKPVVIEAISFNELVQHGKKNTDNIVKGMPLSFDYKGCQVTHENDQSYLVVFFGFHMTITPSDMLIINKDNQANVCSIDKFKETHDTMEASVGIQLIAEERREQIDKHNISIKKDVENNNAYQLTEAAAILSTEMVSSSRKRFSAMPSDWDDEICFKMCKKDRKQRLIIAGALIAAALDKIEFLKE